PGTVADIDRCPASLRDAGSAAAGTPVPIVYAPGSVDPQYGTFDDIPEGDGFVLFAMLLPFLMGLTWRSVFVERRLEHAHGLLRNNGVLKRRRYRTHGRRRRADRDRLRKSKYRLP
ncbi:hypothetical protein ACFQ07_18680, partial [Actinomadura adrarensis]